MAGIRAFILLLVFSSFGHGRVVKFQEDFKNEAQPKEALFLTPYIESGEVAKGREFAKVLNMGDTESYAGFLTVNPEYNSNIYFWFFPAKVNPEEAPVMLWLSGGPGMSSLFGLFVENGPFQIDPKKGNVVRLWDRGDPYDLAENLTTSSLHLKVVPTGEGNSWLNFQPNRTGLPCPISELRCPLNLNLRNTTWTDTYSMLYIDNPIGTGFSFTRHDLGYSTTQDQISENLYKALTQFFKLFPDYVSQDFYIAGESYAGKYIPNLALKIDFENGNGQNAAINLRGMSMNVPYMDPVSFLQYGYGNHLYGAGIISSLEKQHFLNEEAAAIAAIHDSNWAEVRRIMDELMDGVHGPSYFRESTGYESYYNYLQPKIPREHYYYIRFVDQDFVRTKIHVGNSTFAIDGKSEKFLGDDIYQSELGKLEQLLDSPRSYRILIVCGQLDIIVPAVSLDVMLHKAIWSGTEEFRNTARRILRIDGSQDLIGYYKNYGQLTFATVFGGGHFLAFDQPLRNYEVVKKFVSNQFLSLPYFSY